MGLRNANGFLRTRNGLLAAMVAGAVSTPSQPTQPASAIDLVTGMIGQSNMAHLSGESGDCQYYTTNKLARRWANNEIEFVGPCDPTGAVPPGTPYYGNGGWGSSSTVQQNHPSGDGITNFVNALAAATGIPLLTFEYAQSGSSMQQWLSGGSCWASFSSAVTASGKSLDSAVWLQGEENAAQGTSKAQYKIWLRQLHDQLLALSGKAAADFYFGIVILGPGTNYGAEGTMGVIRQAQLEYIAENTGAYLAGVATDMDLAGDQIHFNNVSEIRMGRRYAKSLAAWAKGAPVKWAGPKIASVTRSGTTVTVTVQHAGGTLLKDGAGGSGSSALGFRFFDAGAGNAQIAYTAVSITAANKITLTLASTPSGALTMDYGMANAPFTANLSQATVIRDNDTVPSDGAGLPLIPCGPIIVSGS